MHHQNFPCKRNVKKTYQIVDTPDAPLCSTVQFIITVTPLDIPGSLTHIQTITRTQWLRCYRHDGSMATDKCLLINATGQQADKGDFFFKTIPNNTQVSSLTALSTAPTDTATRCSTVFSEYTQVTVTTGALGSQYNCDWLRMRGAMLPNALRLHGAISNLPKHGVPLITTTS